jgi:hypothetical protein
MRNFDKHLFVFVKIVYTLFLKKTVTIIKDRYPFIEIPRTTRANTVRLNNRVQSILKNK